MSEEQLKAFLEKVKDDSTLQAKLKSAKSSEEVVCIAKKEGYEFTADKLTQRLSNEELESVAGGFDTRNNTGCIWCFTDNCH
ncbi:nif11-like leader peptide domain protein [Synechococcus sp. BIOS-E4-1]|uniref:Nif11-like leader peptide family natural product precursor n=1 Tax=Synechococcus sp. BIOS-E4-1 TaxID=1400864 RepID=UPI001648D715|nr:Nif11-like leader peptide family natural product precursor [Synechococcus sp. BIOS-E4-1]QNI54995.1 nif11-like leader peptide domain protein [Synechococcus sp. BIOS-E4-1]